MTVATYLIFNVTGWFRINWQDLTPSLWRKNPCGFPWFPLLIFFLQLGYVLLSILFVVLNANEISVLVSNYISQFCMDVITYPCRKINESLVNLCSSKRSRLKQARYLLWDIYECWSLTSWWLIIWSSACAIPNSSRGYNMQTRLTFPIPFSGGNIMDVWIFSYTTRTEFTHKLCF